MKKKGTCLIIKNLLASLFICFSLSVSAQVKVDFDHLPYVEEYWMLPAKEIDERANAGDPFAQYVLSHMYKNGVNGYLHDNTLKNSWEEKAQAGFEQLASKGNAVAQFKAGNFYLRSENKNLNKALTYLKQSAEQGYAIAQYQLGRTYRNEKEIQDLELSAYWFKQAFPGIEQAAVNGTKPTDIYCSFLSYLYENGFGGLGSDATKARYWQNQFIESSRKYVATYNTHVFDPYRVILLMDSYIIHFAKNPEISLIFKAYTLSILLENSILNQSVKDYVFERRRMITAMGESVEEVDSKKLEEFAKKCMQTWADECY